MLNAGEISDLVNRVIRALTTGMPVELNADEAAWIEAHPQRNGMPIVVPMLERSDQAGFLMQARMLADMPYLDSKPEFISAPHEIWPDFTSELPLEET